LSFKFNSPKWEVKNTYVLGMLARRPSGGLADWRACPPLHLPPLEPMPELLVTVKLINEFLVAL
jgi:hypothetical protein